MSSDSDTYEKVGVMVSRVDGNIATIAPEDIPYYDLPTRLSPLTELYLDAVGNIILVADFYGNLLYVNQLGRHSLRYRGEDDIQINPHEYFKKKRDTPTTHPKKLSPSKAQRANEKTHKWKKITDFMPDYVAHIHDKHMSRFRSKFTSFNAEFRSNEENSSKHNSSFDIFGMSRDRMILFKRCDGTSFRAEIALRVLPPEKMTDDTKQDEYLIMATVHDVSQEVAFLEERERLQREKLHQLHQLKKNEKKLRELAEIQLRNKVQAEEKERLLYALLHHELRNPLQVILNCTQILQDADDMSEDTIDVLRSLQVSAELMAHLISTAVQFSKIQDDEFVPPKAIFKPRSEFTRISQLFTFVGNMEGITFDFEINFKQSDVFMCAPVTGVVINLLSNSLKFTPKNCGKTIKFKAFTNANNDTLYFEVSDEGAGFTEAQKNLLFNPFQSDTSDLTALFGGSGLALYYCQELLTACGGSLDAESIPDVKSKFYGTLPISPVPSDFPGAALLTPASSMDCLSDQLQLNCVKSVTSNGNSLQKSTSSTTQFSPLGKVASSEVNSVLSRPMVSPLIKARALGDSKTKKIAKAVSRNGKPISKRSKPKLRHGPSRVILYVDDTMLNLKSTSRLLSSMGHMCYTAISGKEGLKLFEQVHGSLDLILMDLSMPEMDGKEVASKIIEWSKRHRVKCPPILAYSGTVTSVVREEVMAIGMVELVSKGIKSADLASLIDYWTQKNKTDVEIVALPDDIEEEALEDNLVELL